MRLPEEYKTLVELNYRMVFYALSDVDDQFNQTERSYSLDLVKAREGQGQVINNLALLDEKGEVLETFWYGQKQNILFAQLKYILEEGSEHIKIDAERVNQEGVLKPLLKNQASTDIKQKQVVLRLWAI